MVERKKGEVDFRNSNSSEKPTSDKIAEVIRIVETLDYPELLQLQGLIGKEYQQKADAARERVIEETKTKFEQLGLSFEDVIATQKKRKRAVRANVAAKYRSPDGKEWSGRGATPKWIKEYEESGGNREAYLIR